METRRVRKVVKVPPRPRMLASTIRYTSQQRTISKTDRRPKLPPLFLKTHPAKKEAKRLEKLAKLAAKTAKAPALGNGVAKEKKVKEVKPKEEEEVYVNITPKGEKKGE
jgi:hypothetical protein